MHIIYTHHLSWFHLKRNMVPTNSSSITTVEFKIILCPSAYIIYIHIFAIVISFVPQHKYDSKSPVDDYCIADRDTEHAQSKDIKSNQSETTLFNKLQYKSNCPIPSNLSNLLTSLVYERYSST